MSGTWNVLAIFGMAKFQTLEHRIRYHWQSRDRILLEVGTFTSRTAGSSDFYGRILHERPRIYPSLQSSWLKLVRSRNFFHTGSVWETVDPSDLFKVGYLTVVAEPPIIRRFGALDSPERVQTAMGHKCLDCKATRKIWRVVVFCHFSFDWTPLRPVQVLFQPGTISAGLVLGKTMVPNVQSYYMVSWNALVGKVPYPIPTGWSMTWWRSSLRLFRIGNWHMTWHFKLVEQCG